MAEVEAREGPVGRTHVRWGSAASHAGTRRRWCANGCVPGRRAGLTEAGWAKIRQAAPGHVATVREHVIDALTPEQVGQLSAVGEALLKRLDPNGVMTPIDRIDETAGGRGEPPTPALSGQDVPSV